MGDSRTVIPVIVGILFLGGLGLYQEGLGYQNKSPPEEYLDFQPYTGNRLMVFNDTRIDYCITNNTETQQLITLQLMPSNLGMIK